MTVMYSPLSRLDRTRLAVVAEPAGDLTTWSNWCQKAFSDGAGLILVRDPILDVNDLLKAGRAVAANGLVGVVEPIDPGARSDVIHLEAPANAVNWPNRLVGCQVADLGQAGEALSAGCQYLVVDHADEALVVAMTQFAEEHDDLIWFVAGCRTLAELESATARGARRAWVAAGSVVEIWSTHLRQVWRSDPAMSSLIRMRRSL